MADSGSADAAGRKGRTGRGAVAARPPRPGEGGGACADAYRPPQPHHDMRHGACPARRGGESTVMTTPLFRRRFRRSALVRALLVLGALSSLLAAGALRSAAASAAAASLHTSATHS